MKYAESKKLEKLCSMKHQVRRWKYYKKPKKKEKLFILAARIWRKTEDVDDIMMSCLEMKW